MQRGSLLPLQRPLFIWPHGGVLISGKIYRPSPGSEGLFFYKSVAARHICLGAQVPRGLALRERLQLEYLNINTAPTILFFDIFSTGGKEIKLWAVFIFKYS